MNKEHTGEMKGRPRRNAMAICQCAGHQCCHCHSSLATAATKRNVRAIHMVLAAIERDSSTRGTPSAGEVGGGQGVARSAMPALLVKAQGGHFPTAANIHDHGATGERQAQGGGAGARTATGLTPTVDAQAIKTVLKKWHTWQWRRAREDNCYGG